MAKSYIAKVAMFLLITNHYSYFCLTSMLFSHWIRCLIKGLVSVY